MIIKKQKEAKVLQVGETESSTKMSLDMDSAQILMQMLSKNLYSDEVGSAVRECASNALDSHRRAGVTDPIVVSLRVVDTGWEFSVEDFGIGLNHQDVENIISKYGKSTKRNSANELGMMGLGFKAPLAYCSSFYFIARKHGMERKYMMYEGEEVNTIDLLYSKPTSERNGVKVIIPIKSWHVDNFRRKIKEQLCYFENVYFDVEDIDNNFVIHRSEYYQFSELCNEDEMHVCLDNVYYPIDWSKLDIDRVKMPLGIRFSLTDNLFPTPNREALRYTAEAKDVIKSRIQDVANHFVDKYNESVETGTDLKSLYEYYNNKERYIKHLGSNLNITELLKYSSKTIVKPNMTGLTSMTFEDLYKAKDFWLSVFKVKFVMKNGKLHNAEKTYVNNWSVGRLVGAGTRYNSSPDPLKVYHYADRVGGVMKDYLRSKHSNNVMLVKITTDEIPMFKSSTTEPITWERILSLTNEPKDQWPLKIADFKTLINLITEDWIDLDSMVVPQDFLDDRKKKKIQNKSKKPGLKGDSGRRKVSGEMSCKQAVELLRYNDGRNCKFESNIYDLKKLMKGGKYFIYTEHENFLDLDELYKHINHDTTKLITLSPREKGQIEKLEIHNLISYEEFMKGKTKTFKRIVTSAKIDTFINKYSDIFDHRNTTIKKASSDLSIKLNNLQIYRDKHYRSHGYGDREKRLYEAMYAVADKHDLYDMKIYPEFLAMEELITNTIPWLDILLRRFHTANNDQDNKMQVSVLVDMMKYYKQKVELEHYITITDETEDLEPVTEEIEIESVF
jgi:hypothetical protein